MTTKARTLILTRTLHSGSGVAEVVLTILREAESHSGFEHLTVAYCHGEESLAPRWRQSHRLVLLRESRFGAFLDVLSLVRRIRPTCIIATDLRLLFAARIASLIVRPVPVILYWIHSIHSIHMGRIRRLAFKKLAAHVSFITPSVAVRDKWQPLSKPTKIHILPNGVFDHGVLSRSPAHDYASKGLYIASFVALKNHSVLVDAIACLAGRGRRVHFDFVGDGALFEATRRHAIDMGVSDLVTCHGLRSDAKSFFRDVDFYVHPADGEAFGMAIVEAMLAGVPVIVRDQGAIKELITDGESGLLVREPGPEALAERIDYLLSMPTDDRLRLGRAARAKALSAYSPKCFAIGLSDIIDEETAARAKRYGDSSARRR